MAAGTGSSTMLSGLDSRERDLEHLLCSYYLFILHTMKFIVSTYFLNRALAFLFMDTSVFFITKVKMYIELSMQIFKSVVVFQRQHLNKIIVFGLL